MGQKLMKQSQIKSIVVACCTCNRPNMLKRSLESIQNLVLLSDIKTELLVIDNDKNGSVKAVIEQLRETFPIQIHYFVEPNRGIANARNRLLNEAISLNATHIAMFDDDEIVDINWLVEHVNCYLNHPEANVISGPTYNKFDKKYPAFIEKNNIFKSATTKKTGEKRAICASGNVFFPTEIMTKTNIYFDNSHVFMGGEDGDFFSRAYDAGYTIIWNNEAVNYEMIGDERADLKWILKRYYYNGYSGTTLRFKNNHNMFKRMFFALKILIVLIINCIALPFAFLLGLTTGFNVLGMIFKTAGKFVATIKNSPIDYYKNICGN